MTRAVIAVEAPARRLLRRAPRALIDKDVRAVLGPVLGADIEELLHGVGEVDRVDGHIAITWTVHRADRAIASVSATLSGHSPGVGDDHPEVRRVLEVAVALAERAGWRVVTFAGEVTTSTIEAALDTI